MTPRRKVFNAYWQLAAERQAIFFNRIAGEAPPWTDDRILNKYKFCNAYRASDRVSQYLIKNVIYQGSQHHEDVVFRTLLFRMFNKIETWQHLQNTLESVTVENFDVNKYADAIQLRIDQSKPIFGGAFILCANKAFGYDKKHMNYLALLRKMVCEDKIGLHLPQSSSLKDVFMLLRSYPLLGNFMSYQMAIDLNYSEVINFSENDFTVAGPGAVRGINKCFEDTTGHSYEYIIQWMVDHQEEAFKTLGIDFQSLWGRPLQAIDCQNLFCEVDKYSRVAFPELKSNRTRIKSTFKRNSSRISYFYPPKWGINKLVETTLKDSTPDGHTSDAEQLSLTLH